MSDSDSSSAPPAGSSPIPPPNSAAGHAPAPPSGRERRSNLALRALIEEMLGCVREMHRQGGGWAPGERAQAEAELESIMARVRSQAVRPVVD